jgi:ribonuclease T1
VVGLLVAVLVALGVWLLWGPDPGTPVSSPGATSSTTQAEVSAISPGGLDPDSGLPWIDPAALPPEARDVLALIDAGGPFPYAQDDQTFGNYEGLLPEHDTGYYREYTVETPGSDDRGARRIIAGSAGERYWTADHYASFERIRT